MDIIKTKEEKFKRFTDVMTGKIPDRVPVLPNTETWIFHYAGISIKKAFAEDADLLFEAFKIFDKDVYTDGVLSISNTFPLNMSSKLGSGLYQVSDVGVQIHGSKGKNIEPNEYRELAKDPLKYFANVIIPKKLPIFKNSFENNVQTIKIAFQDFSEFGRYNAQAINRIENELGLPILVGTTNYISPDVVLDYLRDFVGISTDIKRYPEEVISTCEALYDWILRMFTSSNIPRNGKVIFSPLHLPTYLRPKDFEKFYFPFMKAYVEKVCVKMDYPIYFFMENDWTPYVDIMQDLPDTNNFIGLFEKGDLKFIKEKMKNKIMMMGGMPLSILSMGTKQECIDHAKKCLDELAPGGGYIFSTDKVLMSMNDARAENLIAVCEYIKENGKY